MYKAKSAFAPNHFSPNLHKLSNHLMKNLKLIILKSWFIAIIPTVAIIVLLPDLFDKFEIRKVGSGNLIEERNNPVIKFCDLDNDGFSEQIISYTWENLHSLQVVTYDGGIVDQWNMDGDIPNIGERFICGDYDNDQFDEIYPFSQTGDTIYINCFEPFDTVSPLSFSNIKICVLTHEFAKPDCAIHDGHFVDMNGDGWKDIVFSITSGYAKFPRNIYIYYINNDTLLVSPKIGTYLLNTKIVDLDADGTPEIVGNTTAGGNIPDSICPYTDYSAWILVFNHKLHFVFEPIEFPGFRSEIEVLPVTINHNSLVAAFYNHKGPETNYPALFLINVNGEIVNEFRFPSSDKIDRGLFVSGINCSIRFHIIDVNGKIVILNNDLQQLSTIELKQNISAEVQPIDLDNDSVDEFVLRANGKIIITDLYYDDKVEYNLDTPVSLSRFTVIKNGTKRPALFYYGDNEYIILEYYRNPAYYAKYPIYLFIYFLVWLFILLIRKLQMIQLQKQERIRNQIANLQLKGFKNQMDPHFTFNVFNTMAHKIQQESPVLYKSFMEFTNLIRKTLVSSDSITRTLDDEISQLKSYLELEKLRFPDKLDYEIRVEDDIDPQTRIPKMILQTYVENAIKHGIQHKAGSGKVTIKIAKLKSDLLFLISDDGIGREKAKGLSTDSTGFGIKIMDNYFKLFNDYNETKIRHQTIDLFDSNQNPTGTEVRILVPLNFSYKLKKRDR